MSYCWLKKRGDVYYLHFAKSTGLKVESLRTSDRALAKEVQRRRESDFFCNASGIQRKVIKRVHLSDLVKLFTAHKKAQGVESKTLLNYLTTFNHLGTYLKMDPYVDQIRVEHLEGFIVQRRGTKAQRDETKLLAPKTIRNEVFALITLFAFAEDRGYVVETPTKRLKRPRRVVYDAPRHLTYDEYLMLKKAISSERFSDYVDFYLLTGLRREDGLRVTAADLDFTAGTATFFQHKTGTHKTIAINQDLRPLLKRMLARVGKGEPIVQMHKSRLTANFANARDRAGLPKSITFHSLRHTFASWLAALGTDFKTLQELIGHRSQESTQIYVHASDPNKRSAIELLRLPKRKAS